METDYKARDIVEIILMTFDMAGKSDSSKDEEN